MNIEDKELTAEERLEQTADKLSSAADKLAIAAERMEKSSERLEEKSQPKKKGIGRFIYLLPSVLFAMLMIFLVTAKPAHAAGLATGGTVLFGTTYLFQLPKASRLVKTGNRALALKTATASFVPLLGTANATIMEFYHSPLVQSYIQKANSGLVVFHNLLNSVTPEYGDLIYKSLLDIIIVGANLIAIRAFLRLLRTMKIIGRASQQ